MLIKSYATGSLNALFFPYLLHMVLEHYISELLYRYDCVVVPNFGAFLTQQVSARINQTTNTFFAPTKTISFNQQVTSNDGLLISHVSETEKISFETAQSKIHEFTVQWKETLKMGKKLSLPNIGLLWTNAEGKIQFEPSLQVNYLTASFGLSSVNSIPITRETLKEEVVVLEEKIPFIISTEQRETTSFRPYLKYAAILLLAFSTGLTGFRFYQDRKIEQQLVRQEAQKQVAKEIQEATFFNVAPLELPTVNVDVVSTQSPTISAKHHIVAGAFRIRANADRKIKALQALGYKATYYGTNTYGLHMVTYDRFEDAQEALTALREIKRTQSKDAWLHSEK